MDCIPASVAGRLAYEVTNLVDGMRTVGEICEWLDLLVRAGVVRLRMR